MGCSLACTPFSLQMIFDFILKSVEGEKKNNVKSYRHTKKKKKALLLLSEMATNKRMNFIVEGKSTTLKRLLDTCKRCFPILNKQRFLSIAYPMILCLVMEFTKINLKVDSRASKVMFCEGHAVFSFCSRSDFGPIFGCWLIVYQLLSYVL